MDSTISLLFSFVILVASVRNEEIPSMDQIIANAAKEVRDSALLWDDSSILVELDMRFTHDQWQRIQEARGDYNHDRRKRKAERNLIGRWTNGVIPYRISEGFTAKGHTVISEALKEWSRVSCISFRKASGDEPSVNFLPTGGCSSNVGMTGRAGQPLTLGNGCLYKGIVIHEMGHALGFFHEQSRPDRDNFVTIHRENIVSNMEYNFKKYPSTVIDTHDIPYDIGSVMHYGGYYFSKNGRRTISARHDSDNKLMGNRYGLTFEDIHIANKMYKCSVRCKWRSCGQNAFLGKDCRCWCKGPSRREPVVYCDTREPIPVSTGVKPTAKPTTRPPISEHLVDNHSSCKDWASAGYCKDNDYVIENCEKSCSIEKSSQPTTPPVEEDKNQYCPMWAEHGECERNPGYMLVYCKISCGRKVQKCKDAAPRMCRLFNRECQSITIGAMMRKFCSRTCNSCTAQQRMASCEDIAKRACSLLSASGKCDSKDEKVRKHMQAACPKSCHLCHPQDEQCPSGDCKNTEKRGRAGRIMDPSCKDRLPFCPKWARIFGCNSLFLRDTVELFCRRSCNLC